MAYPHIVIFDGVCNFCNGVVNFIIERDPEARFVFAPIQSELAGELIKKHCPDVLDMDTILLIKNEKCYVRSDAVLEIFSELKGTRHMYFLFKIMPRCVRNFLYKLFARSRYVIFGRRTECMVPDERFKDRFMG